MGQAGLLESKDVRTKSLHQTCMHNNADYKQIRFFKQVTLKWFWMNLDYNVIPIDILYHSVRAREGEI